MNVLSLFDGASCGQQALEMLGVEIDNYFSSEIDKYAMAVTKYNYPDTIFLGSVIDITIDPLENGNILINKKHEIDPTNTILIGGSPCTGFSFSGKRKGACTKCNIKITTLKQYLALKEENFEFEGQSYLFWEYVRIKKELEKYNKNLIFLLENVKMDKEWKEMFDKTMNVTPVRINSSLVSAQTRDRFYWTSKQNIPQPVDKELFWNSIQINNAENVMYYSPQAFEWIFKSEDRKKRFKTYTNETMSKMQMVEASHHKGYSNQRCFGIMDNTRMRYIHVIECERLQTMRDNYTAKGVLEDGKEVNISNTQRYRMIGNGWTVRVIAHILEYLLEESL